MIFDELIFQYSNLGFLPISKEFNSLLLSYIPWAGGRINYRNGGMEEFEEWRKFEELNAYKI